MSTNTELKQRRLAAAPRGVGVMCEFHAAQADNQMRDQLQLPALIFSR